MDGGGRQEPVTRGKLLTTSDQRPCRCTCMELSNYLMGPYNAGPKSTSFLRVALIKAGVKGAGVKRAILERECHVFEKLSFFEIWYIVSLACTYP